MGSKQKDVCWFCQTRTERPNRAVHVEMYGNVRPANEHTLLGVQQKTAYDTVTIHVPRCVICADAHDKQGCFGVVGGGVPLLGVIGYAIYAYVTGQIDDIISVVLGTVCIGVVVAVVGAFIGTFISAFFTPSESNLRSEQDYPPIRDLLGRGWKVGNQPGPYERQS